MTEQELREMFAKGKRCQADRDGDCDCESRYRIEGRNHCYLDILEDEANPDRYGA